VLDDRDNRGPGKEAEEASASDGQYIPSWIWLSNSNAISPDEVNEDMRVEWAQCVARADRWGEEVTLLQEEIRRVVHFLEWKSKDWLSRVNVRTDVVTSEVSSGISAYARKQASIFRNLAIRFCQRWRSTLISLSLPHDWATEFLKTQGVAPVNRDSTKREGKRHEHKPPKSLVTSPHVESTAATTTTLPISTNPETSTAPPSIPANPETSNDDDEHSDDDDERSDDDDERSDDDDESFSDDSAEDSSESDESEYESSSWDE
jgi:hypothetical protein